MKRDPSSADAYQRMDEMVMDSRAAFIRSCAILYADFEMLEFFGVKVSDGGHIFAKVERPLS